jgi:hypothetical protein
MISFKIWSLGTYIYSAIKYVSSSWVSYGKTRVKNDLATVYTAFIIE